VGSGSQPWRCESCCGPCAIVAPAGAQLRSLACRWQGPSSPHAALLSMSSSMPVAPTGQVWGCWKAWKAPRPSPLAHFVDYVAPPPLADGMLARGWNACTAVQATAPACLPAVPAACAPCVAAPSQACGTLTTSSMRRKSGPGPPRRDERAARQQRRHAGSHLMPDSPALPQRSACQLGVRPSVLARTPGWLCRHAVNNSTGDGKSVTPPPPVPTSL
jgi:hypothetical protein